MDLAPQDLATSLTEEKIALEKKVLECAHARGAEVLADVVGHVEHRSADFVGSLETSPPMHDPIVRARGMHPCMKAGQVPDEARCANSEPGRSLEREEEDARLAVVDDVRAQVRLEKFESRALRHPGGARGLHSKGHQADPCAVLP